MPPVFLFFVAAFGDVHYVKRDGDKDGPYILLIANRL